MTSHDHAKQSVFDAMFEHAFAHPEHAASDGQVLRASVLREALRLVPDEFRAPRSLSLRDQFVESVVANAAATGRSAHTLADLALDV
jgi:hypothetical protein